MINNKEYYLIKDGTSELSEDVWHVTFSKQHAFKIYGDFESLDTIQNTVSTEPSVVDVNSVTNFVTQTKNLSLNKTKIVNDIFDGNRIELDLDSRILTIIMDNSGSMTWNDNKKERYAIAERLVKRLKSTYPGSLKYNLLEFNGGPINTTIFSVLNNPQAESQDAQSLNSQFFQDQESGFAGVRVLRKQGDFPSSPVDGDIVSEGFAEKSLSINLTEGEEYFVTVFTFDKNGNFSKGKEIKAIPRSCSAPLGISKFEASMRVGTGVAVDENVSALWHFAEGEGNVLYDFVNNKNNLDIIDSNVATWSLPGFVPIGISALRFNGINTIAQGAVNSSSVLDSVSNTELSIMAWVFPYDVASGDGVIFSRADNSNFNYILSQNNDGLKFEINGVPILSVSGILTQNEWQHIAVTYNVVTGAYSFYVSGVLADSGVASSPVPAFSGNANLSIGGSLYSGRNNFFGKITELSVHNLVRSAIYISSAASKNITPKDINGVSSTDQDNGDRMALIRYEIPLDFNFVGGKVKIIRKSNSAPANIDDGDVIYDTEPSAGKFIITDNFPFILGESYFYRIFTQNAYGCYCFIEDASLIEMVIPPIGLLTIDRITSSMPALSPISNVSAIIGNRKIWLKWSNPLNDSNVERVKIYKGSSGFPVVTESGSSGDLALDSDDIADNFVCRDLDNDAIVYFTIITLDRYGRVSTPVNVSAAPSTSSTDNSIIPLLEVDNVSYEQKGGSSLIISWSNPIEFKTNLNGWFDDRVFIYASISDDYGLPLNEDAIVTIKVDAEVNKRVQSKNVFNSPSPFDGAISSDLSGLYTFSTSNNGAGVITASLTMGGNVSILSAIEDVTFSIRVFAYVPDTTSQILDSGLYSKNKFEFTSKPATVKLSNPVSVQLLNRDGKKVTQKCPIAKDSEASTTSDIIEYQSVSIDGSYIRANNPFYARAVVTFKGLPVDVTKKISIVAFDANFSPCDEKLRSATAVSSTILLPNNQINFTNESIEVLDNNGHSTGVTKNVSYVDIPIYSPELQQAAYLFVQYGDSGIFSTQSMYLLFPNFLQITLNATAPIGDGQDTAEQIAQISVLNPDFPDDSSLTRTVPNLTAVRWDIAKGENAQNPPFFSTDSVPVNNGVYSYSRSGVARGVLFGPTKASIHQIIKDGEVIISGEKYTVTATISWNGMTVSDSKDLEVWPPGTGSKKGITSRILMEMPSIYNQIYADGEDYVRLDISRDPSASTTTYSSCFRSCSADSGSAIYSLPVGQIVKISVPQDWEALWGDIKEEVDEYTGEKFLLIGNGANKSGSGYANIAIGEGAQTYVYFRINKYFEPIAAPADGPASISDLSNILSNGGLINPCSCLQINSDDKKSYQEEITGSSRIFIGGNSFDLVGGGSIRDGAPPVIIYPKEPLSVKIVDKRVNGVPSDSVVIDGVSTNEFIVEVSFAGRPVPDGTAVNVITTDTNNLHIVPVSNIAYTRTFIDELLDPINGRSYASVLLKPIQPVTAFKESIVVTSNYNKNGNIDRLMGDCITLKHDLASIADNEVVGSFNSRVSRYDINTDSWSLTTSIASPLAYLSLESVGNKLYAIGGIGTNNISSLNQSFDLASLEWTNRQVMPTARFAAQSAVFDGKIYVFGGLTIDPDSGDMVVSESVEAYNTVTDEWEVLNSMPLIDTGGVTKDGYGVAFGSATYVQVGGEDRIYIISGVRAVSKAGSIQKYNDRILYYKISSNEWVYSDLIESDKLDLYQRVSPFVFLNSNDNNIFVIGGIFNTVDSGIVFLTDAAKYNVVSGVLANGDADTDISITPRFRGGSVVFGDKAYFVGGSTQKANFSQTLESFDYSVSPMPYAKLSSIGTGVSSAGVATASDMSSDYIFVVGGFYAGKEDGFIKISTRATTPIRLDGKKAASISIDLLNQYGNYPSSDIKVSASGYLIPKTVNSQTNEVIVDESVKYPVLFSSDTVVISGGNGVISLLPRSDDIINDIENNDSNSGVGAVHIGSGDVRNPYDILVQLTINDDFYFGQTTKNISVSTNISSSSSSSSIIEDQLGTDSSVIPKIGDGPSCVEIPTSPAWSGFSRGISVDVAKVFSSNSTNKSFDIIPDTAGQLESPLISFYADIDWIPRIVKRVINNSEDTKEVISQINDSMDSIPFGGSDLFDTLSYASVILSDNSINDIKKNICVFTDSESNLSSITLSDIIDEINSIDGNKMVPVVIGNFSIVDPIYSSAQLSGTNVNDLKDISDFTGGQSFTVLSGSFEDESVNMFVGQYVGSIGNGSAIFTIDMGDNVNFGNMKSYFDLPDNTNAFYNIQYSSDGYNFSDFGQTLLSNTSFDFSSITARYLKIEVELFTGFSSSNNAEYEEFPNAGSPALTHIEIGYNTTSTAYWYINQVQCRSLPQQVVFSLNTNNVGQDQIEVGVSQTNSHNWLDFQNGGKKIIPQDGKIVIPLRPANDDLYVPNEPLMRIDKYAYKMKNGSVEPGAKISVLNILGDVIDSSMYKIYHRDGMIVFKAPQYDNYQIRVEYDSNFKIGLKLKNTNPSSSITASGLGFMYNTNIDLLPPVEPIAPTVSNLSISPLSPSPYSKIVAAYDFSDANNDIEDKNSTQIKWYINSVHIGYLDNLISWNDIDDPKDPLFSRTFTFDVSSIPSGSSALSMARAANESILKAGDIVYFTVKPSDGSLRGITYTSPTVAVTEDEPTINQVIIKGKNADGSFSDKITSASSAVLIFNLNSQNDSNTSSISWFVNGQLFKAATYGTAGADTILSGETGIGGTIGLVMNNEIFAEVVPATSSATGNSVVRTETTVISNSVPFITLPQINPVNPTSTQSLVLSFVFNDTDISVAGDQNQKNQSFISWFRAANGRVDSFTEVVSLKGLSVVASSNTAIGERWQARITPYDLLDFGEQVISNDVIIR